MRLLVVLYLLLGSQIAGAADAASEVERNIRDGLKSLAPDIEISGIRQSPIEGLYEVVIGTDVIYMTADGRYALRGELIDIREKQNITQSMRADMRRQLLADLPRQDMIRFAGAETRHVIYVFTDIDCGYCRKMHEDVPRLTKEGVEVRYLAYPRAGLDSETYEDMVSVWCAANQNDAMTRAKSGREVKPADCDNPVADQYRAGQALGIRGTPAIFLENGEQLPGYVPPGRLVRILNGSG